MNGATHRSIDGDAGRIEGPVEGSPGYVWFVTDDVLNPGETVRIPVYEDFLDAFHPAIVAVHTTERRLDCNGVRGGLPSSGPTVGRDDPDDRKGEQMPTSTKKRSTPPSRVRSAVATKSGTETGTEIRDELLRCVEEEVGAFDTAEPKSKRYDRLLLPGMSIAFGYVFEAREESVQIRMHERFLPIESKLPKLGFVKTKNGFWYTITSKKDAARAAKAFRVCADELQRSAS